MPSLVERGQVGKREDLADIIENVDQKDMPVTSMIRKGSAPKNSIVEWLISNAKMSAASAGISAMAANLVPARLRNFSVSSLATLTT